MGKDDDEVNISVKDKKTKKDTPEPCNFLPPETEEADKTFI